MLDDSWYNISVETFGNGALCISAGAVVTYPYTGYVGKAPPIRWTSRPAERLDSDGKPSEGRFAMPRLQPCEVCGNEFKVYPSEEGRARYCSKACANKAKERRAVIVCASCGQPVERRPSEFKNKTSVYCSMECRYRAEAGHRTCSVCKAEYPATSEFFWHAKGGKFGLQSVCKSCMNAVYRPRYRRREMQYNAQYRREHPEWVAGVKRRYYERHRDEVIAKSSEYRKRTPRYWQRSREKSAERDAQRRARRRKLVGSFTKADVVRQLAAQEGRCYYCGDPVTAYHVDHYIPLARGGSNGPENIVIACPHCNHQKRAMMPDEFIRWKRRT